MAAKLRRDDYSHRPILKSDDLDHALFMSNRGGPREFLMETSEFLKMARKWMGIEINRRTLQHYSSPRYQLMPLPIHMGKHKAYYLFPEHEQRLRLVNTLTAKYGMKLDEAGQILRNLPEKHEYLILRQVFSPVELRNFMKLSAEGVDLKDLLFFRISWILQNLTGEFIESKDYVRVLFDRGREFLAWLMGPKWNELERRWDYLA